MHIFRDEKSQDPINFGAQFEGEVLEMILQYDASDLRMNFFGGGQEKMRAFFNIKDKDKAIACYK